MSTADRLIASAELHRLMGGDRLARPLNPLASDGTAGRRDPSPTWDPWYCLGLPERRQLIGFMAPAGDPRGLGLDTLADLIGAGSLDDALDRWRGACQLARAERPRDEWDAWREADEQAEADAELYGPQEWAARLGVSVPAFHQRRHRGLLPAADLVISGVPIWTGETIRVHEEGLDL